MSFLGRLFSGPPLDERIQNAEALLAAGQLGDAKLAFEKACELARKERADAVAGLQTRIDECCDAIARRRIEDSRSALEAGHFELALDELEHALQTAVSPALRAEIQDIIDATERTEARSQGEVVAQSDEDRFEILAGAWEDDQHDEYVAQGAPLAAAVVALDDGRAEEGRAILEGLVPAAAEPRYLWFELGRARLICGDLDGARDALGRFLERIGPEEGGDARLISHMELAAIHTERHDLEAAIAQYEAALTAFPGDARAYLAMGTFFRRRALPDEAVEVLSAGLEIEPDGRPDFRLWLELGLAHADKGQDGLAMEWLEKVVEYLSSHQHRDLPPEGAARLAQLYEKAGRPERASDLYAMLAAGSDRDNHARYSLEAGRLMQQLGLEREARRMLQRAEELAPEGSDLAERARSLLDP